MNIEKPTFHEYICFNFYSGWREIDQLYKQELGNDITPQVTYILQLFEKTDDEISINQISEGMKLNKSSVSNLIARMEKKGLVRRAMDLQDRRGINVSLTETGLDLLVSLRDRIKTLEDKISNNISPEEKETLFRIVNKISNTREENTPSKHI